MTILMPTTISIRMLRLAPLSSFRLTMMCGNILAYGKYSRPFADPEDNFDWGIRAEVNLAASDDAGYPVLKILSVGEF